MPSFNSVTFIGHLARDPELRHSQKGTAFLTCAMGVNYGWGDNKDSFFVDFVIFGKRGEAFDKICAKGEAVLIQGELQQDEWQDKQTGETRRKFKVVVSEWQKISSKRGGGSERSRRSTPVDEGGGGDGAEEMDSIPF